MTFPHVVVARLYEPIEPIDRGERYEDPLQLALEAARRGRVTGGGSALGATGEVAFADLEIELANLGDALQLAIEVLEKAGAPRDSEILRGDDVLREFGRTQCLAIYFDGTSLPDEIYANLDFTEVVHRIAAAAGPDSFHGVWQGAEETGVFYFGDDAEAMLGRVEPLLYEMPIGQNARVVVGHGSRRTSPRTVRIPRRDS